MLSYLADDSAGLRQRRESVKLTLCPVEFRLRFSNGDCMKLTRRRFLSAGAAASLFGRCSAAVAQAYPARSIRLVVPFPPGGAFDFVGRPWAEKIKSSLGTVVVENIGGGGSSLGAAAVVRSPPDGYTLLLGGTQTHVNEALLKSRPLYDPAKDLDAVTGVAAYFLAVVVHPALAVRTLPELREYAKANPGTVSYGHAGVGSIQHLTGELLKSQTGMHEMVQVPYRGTGPVITDVMSGQIPVGILGITGQVLELHRAGKLRIVAVTSPKRLASAPDVPTAVEVGVTRHDRNRIHWAVGAGGDAAIRGRANFTSDRRCVGGSDVPARVERSSHGTGRRARPGQLEAHPR